MKWIFLSILLLPSLALGAGLRQPDVTPTSRDEGDSPIQLAVSCPGGGSAWTTVVSSSTIRRALYMQISFGVQPSGICLSTNTLAAEGCNDGVGGAELGTATVTSATIYHHAAVNCKTRGVGTGTLKGYEARDKRDYGNIGSNQLQ